MFKINFILSILMILVLAACSKPGSSPSSASKGASPSAEVDSAPIVVEIQPSGAVADGLAMDIVARKNKFNVKSIVVRNNLLIEQEVVVINTLSSAVELESNCPVAPAKLARRSSCFMFVYFNRENDHAPGFQASAGTISVQGKIIAVSVRVDGLSDEAEAVEEMILSSNNIDFGSFNDAEEKRKYIVIRNYSLRSLPVIYDDLETLALGYGAETSCPASGSNLLPRRACAIYFSHSGEIAGAGNHSITLQVTGKTVTLHSIITEAPIFTSNPELHWVNPLSSSIFEMEAGLNESMIFKIENNTSYSAQSIFDRDFAFGDINLYPDAFKIVSGCDPVLFRRTCELKMSFDPERFHFGVEFSKDAFIKDEAVTIHLTGNSPCNPDHATPRPDAAYGKKLNEAKTACIPNVGIFDDPDSVFGHAVFQ